MQAYEVRSLVLSILSFRAAIERISRDDKITPRQNERFKLIFRELDTLLVRIYFSIFLELPEGVRITDVALDLSQVAQLAELAMSVFRSLRINDETQLKKTLKVLRKLTADLPAGTGASYNETAFVLTFLEGLQKEVQRAS